jgi:glycosyltransferase involved in cell wall biosynthesis
MTFIVVPAYNEEKKIGRVIRDLFNHGFKNLVVVDDGSIDSTISEVKKTEAKLLRHLVNRGQGAALQTGDDY